MAMVLAFAPFIVFVIVERISGPKAGLLTAALVALILLLRDVVIRKKSVKVLDIGTVILFGGLALYAFARQVNWSIIDVRLRVDVGLLLIVLTSILIRRPFTLQYAREETPVEMWSNPVFIRTNYVITAIWAVAFTLMVVADLVLRFMPNVPQKVGIGVTILAIYGAIRFTSWYPERVRAS